MTILLGYDVETTGLPLWDSPSTHPDQPRITQIAAELIDEETREVLAGMHCIIKPDGWEIPKKLQELTGITMERAHRTGIPIGVALNIFMQYWRMCGMRFGHNEKFDARMIRIELQKMWKSTYGKDAESQIADQWRDGASFCTMIESQGILKLPPTLKMVAAGFMKPKAPNLGEAYQHFTGKPLVNAHNAAVDLEACKAVYFGILEHHCKTAKETTT